MAKINKMIQDITGNSEEEQKLREQLDILTKLAENKCELFKKDIVEMLSDSGRDKYEVVGNRAIYYKSGYHVNIKEDCDAAIGEAVDSFFKGSSGIKDGFKSIVKTALDSLISSMEIGEYLEDLFFVYPENNSIVRVDVKAYKYTFSGSGLMGKVENLFCYTMAKSIVDHTKLTKDELLYFMTDMCNGMADADIGQVEAFVREMIEVWTMLDEEISSYHHNGLNAKYFMPNREKGFENALLQRFQKR